MPAVEKHIALAVSVRPDSDFQSPFRVMNELGKTGGFGFR